MDPHNKEIPVNTHVMRRSLIMLAALMMVMSSSAYSAEPGKDARSKKSDDASPRIRSKVDIAPSKRLTGTESREVSFAAGRILKHVTQARNAIADHQHDAASKNVDQGLKLIEIIDHVLPHYSVKTEIRAGDLVYVDEDDVARTFVTLFDELAHRDIITPVLRAKKEAETQAGTAKAEVKKTERTNAVHADDKNPAPAAPVVALEDIDYTAVKLDLRFASRMLEVAKQNLKEKDHKWHLQADAALLALQAGAVIFEYEEVDLPLEQAADNLKLAEGEMRLGRSEEAKVALRVVGDELKQYEKSAGENRAKEVRQVSQELDKLTTELAKGKPSDKRGTELANAISGMWQRVTTWFKKQ